MPIADKVAAAKKMGEFLQAVITHGGFKLKYRITVDPPIAEQREWEHPEILVEFAGPDSGLLLERGGELLRSFELLGTEILRLQGNEHEKIWFDCKNFRSLRIEELQMAARAAAEKVRATAGARPRLRPAWVVAIGLSAVLYVPHRMNKRAAQQRQLADQVAAPGQTLPAD